jgi:hypothetical protein
MNNIKIESLKFTYVTKEEGLGTRILITSKNSTAILAHSFNSHGYCTHWQEYRVNFHIWMFYMTSAVGNRQKLIYELQQ